LGVVDQGNLELITANRIQIMVNTDQSVSRLSAVPHLLTNLMRPVRFCKSEIKRGIVCLSG